MNGKKIKLRALEPGDLEALYQWENQEELWEISGTSTPFSKYVLQQFIETAQNDLYTNKQVRLIIEEIETKRTLGCIDLFEFNPKHKRAGLGILIAEEKDRKQGLGEAALLLMLEYCFETLNLHQVFANIGANNDASLKLFKKCGFVPCGIKKDWNESKGQWNDEIMLQRFPSN